MSRFKETAPSEALRPFVHAVWEFEAGDDPPPTHHIPPDGCVSVVLSAGPGGIGAVLVGPRMVDLAVPIAPGARFVGVRMRPEAAGILLDLAPREWAGRVAPPSDASPALAEARRAPDVDTAATKLLAALEARAADAPAPDALVRDALAAMDAGELRVGAIAHRLRVSSRTLQRRFVAATGLTPKSFARIRRFRLAIARVLDAAPPEWGRVAAEHGYSDQAHLTREVAALAGAPPSAVEMRLARIEHVDVNP